MKSLLAHNFLGRLPMRPMWPAMGVVGLTIWLALAAVACSGPIGLLRPAPTSTPAPPRAELAAMAFFRTWEEAQFNALYDLISSPSKALVTREQLVARYRQAYQDAAIVSVNTQIRSVLQQSTEAQVAYHVAYESSIVGRFEAEHVLTMTLENGRWLVNWGPDLIWPPFQQGSRFRIVERAPSRGNIYDRNGLGLAVEGLSVTIGVVPGQIPERSTVLTSLATVTGVPLNTIRAKLAQAKPDWFVPIREIPVDEYERNGRALENLPGVVLRRSFIRAYNEGLNTGHVVGYLGKIRAEELADWQTKGYRGDENVGQAGLERLCEAYLTGRKGGILKVVNAQGDDVATVVERDALPSRNVYATIDRRLQGIARAALGNRRGAIVALDPVTGAILVMVSNPPIDPNQFVGEVKPSLWESLRNDPGRPLLNRATQGTYPPGSTFKVVTTAAALEAGGFAAESPFFCGGTWFGLGGQWTKTCWLLSGHGRINLRDGLTASCDVVFYEVGKHLDELDQTILAQYARGFGLGRPTGLEGFDEAAGLVPDPAWKQKTLHEMWYPGDSVNMAIGQGYILVTPLQMAVMMAAVANGGTLYQPQLVERVEASADEPEIRLTPKSTGKLPISAEHLEVIRKALLAVTTTTRGTAVKPFEGFPYQVAGKTGTAENPNEEPHSWFVGYVPAEKPQIAMAVIVEESGEGSEAAAPVFRRVAEGFLGIEPPPTPTSASTVTAGVTATRAPKLRP